MKTEDLTYAEAVRAYGNKKTVKNSSDEAYWLDENDNPRTDAIEQEDTPYFTPDEAPFSIVGFSLDKPKSLSLTALEALKCEKFKIIYPEGINCTDLEFTQYSGWTDSEVAVAFLAEKQGWHMEEVKEDA